MDAQSYTAILTDCDRWEERTIPKRPWVVPGYLLRGAVTVVVGPPSSMKSSLMLSWACAAALGRDYGRFCPLRPVRVVVYNVEDDLIEQRRRLSAALRQFDATPGDVEGKIIRTCPGPKSAGTLLGREPDGLIMPFPAMTEIQAHLSAMTDGKKPSVLIVDPFVELHGEEENDNTAIRAIIAEFRRIAVDYNIAVVLVHHTRKGASASPGDPDIARGASAIIGAARVVVTLTGMSEDDAKSLGVPADAKHRSHFVRLDDGKSNYGPLREASWFEKVPYELDNGEIVPAAVPWEPPQDVISLETLLDVEAAVAGGCNGEPWAKQGGSERDIKNLLSGHGITTSAGQTKAKQHLTQAGVRVADYRKANRQRATGYRTKDGQPASVNWIELGDDEPKTLGAKS